jgi:hypothetical protein
MPSRWEFLLEKKPVPVIDQLVEEVAKLVSRELLKWPLEVSEVEANFVAEHAALVGADSKRPDAKVFEESFRLAIWELEHETDSYDDYMRNRRFLEHGLSMQDRPALLFISRWLFEQMLGLKDATNDRVKRRDLIRCLEQTRARLSAV